MYHVRTLICNDVVVALHVIYMFTGDAYMFYIYC